MPFAQFKPATYDLTGITEVQMEAVVEALAMLVQSDRIDRAPTADSAEMRRRQHVAAMELLDATKSARRAAAGTQEEED